MQPLKSCLGSDAAVSLFQIKDIIVSAHFGMHAKAWIVLILSRTSGDNITLIKGDGCFRASFSIRMDRIKSCKRCASLDLPSTVRAFEVLYMQSTRDASEGQQEYVL